MTGLTPVTKRSAVDEASDRLLTAIALGEFSVGERLPTERELTVSLGLSRPTIRAAMARLREIGCVEVVRGRTGGHFVRSGGQQESAAAVGRILSPRWDHAKQLLDTRCLIEGLIARTAAQRHLDPELEVIEVALAAHAKAQGAEAIRTADATLHRAIAAAAHNDQLAVYSGSLLAEVNAGLPIEPFRGTRVERARAEHRGLVAAIRARDAEKAADLAIEHFKITSEAFVDVMESSKGVGTAVR